MAEPTGTRRTTRTSSSADTGSDETVDGLLARAANESVNEGINVETFMARAWAAYIEARPGMREKLEDMQLRAQLDELREAGKIGQA